MFLKLVGRCNSSNTWNYFSEFKILGTYAPKIPFPNIAEGYATIYPNPASDNINISLKETVTEPDLIRINDFSGNTIYQVYFVPGVNNISLPRNLQTGIYVVMLLTNEIIMFTQKLVISK